MNDEVLTILNSYKDIEKIQKILSYIEQLEQVLEQEKINHQTTKQQFEQAIQQERTHRTYIYKTITMPFRKAHRFLLKLYSAIQRLGLVYLLKLAMNVISNKITNLIYKKSNIKTLGNALKNTRLPVIIYPPYLDFNIPLYQRPQHLAHILSKNYLYLSHSKNTTDSISHIIVKENLLLLPPDLYPVSLHTEIENKKILFLYSHPSKQWDIKLVNQYLNQNNVVIYDYLDELNDEIFGSVDQEAMERHNYALSNRKIILLVTASKLLDNVKQHRPCLTNVYFVPNAVNISHFQRPKHSVNELDFLKGKKVIGYFGALASWVDYELIDKLSKLGSEYHILLLGYIYDRAFRTTSLDKRNNITVLGPIKYDVLPDYAKYFDISIIPFCINGTTLATSPIKLFEYMALGKPIISTALPECRKYQSVLIAKDHDEFISLIDKALKIPKDDEYFKIMQKEAEENTWDARAKVIIEAINENLNAS